MDSVWGSFERLQGEKASGGEMNELVRKSVTDLKNEMIQIRRELHQYPELGFREKRTANMIEEYLRNLELEVQTGVAETGVVGLLSGCEPGRTILIRADMDALPIEEANDVTYRSKNPGVMHACGHDGHMAVSLIAAKILSRLSGEFSGQIKFVFQPGEEGFGGAREMIKQGVMSDPIVDAAIGLHLTNTISTGRLAVRAGPIMASMDSFRMEITGKSGHAAMPEQAVDAILISSHVITALQTLISKEISPLEPLVVHVGMIQGGRAFNVVADHVELKGTVRATNSELQKSIPKRMERIINNLSKSLRGSGKLEYHFDYPPVVNDERIAQMVKKVAISVLGKDNILVIPPMMASDDIGFFLQDVGGCFFFVGSSNPDKDIMGAHHNPHFDFDEDAMVIGAEILIGSALEYLGYR